MTAIYSAQGTLLQVDISGTFTTVAQADSLDFPSGEVQFFDANSLDAGVDIPDGELVGQSTPGECSGSIIYDPADAVHKLLAKDIQLGGTNRDWKIVMPDSGSSTCTFSGSIKTFQPKAALKAAFKADFSIKLSSVAQYPT